MLSGHGGRWALGHEGFSFAPEIRRDQGDATLVNFPLVNAMSKIG